MCVVVIAASGGVMGCVLLCLQEEGRGRGQEGQLPVQQGHVLTPPHGPRGAPQDQLPDPR